MDSLSTSIGILFLTIAVVVVSYYFLKLLVRYVLPGIFLLLVILSASGWVISSDFPDFIKTVFNLALILLFLVGLVAIVEGDKKEKETEKENYTENENEMEED